ncbi:hypothetical protein BB559_004511 [Furculomyces boomerangus]|uniref:Uncharacterized protein n=1 Tax=Furculomyces boomerangus TaxID=61424 RepID=A0A2T9YE82_9FUNG|nr:hypothetical protein BB559_004511 [Furculomyces boomerangus]
MVDVNPCPDKKRNSFSNPEKLNYSESKPINNEEIFNVLTENKIDSDFPNTPKPDQTHMKILISKNQNSTFKNQKTNENRTKHNPKYSITLKDSDEINNPSTKHDTSDFGEDPKVLSTKKPETSPTITNSSNSPKNQQNQIGDDQPFYTVLSPIKSKTYQGNQNFAPKNTDPNEWSTQMAKTKSATSNQLEMLAYVTMNSPPMQKNNYYRNTYTPKKQHSELESIHPHKNPESYLNSSTGRAIILSNQNITHNSGTQSHSTSNPDIPSTSTNKDDHTSSIEVHSHTNVPAENSNATLLQKKDALYTPVKNNNETINPFNPLYNKLGSSKEKPSSKSKYKSKSYNGNALNNSNKNSGNTSESTQSEDEETWQRRSTKARRIIHEIASGNSPLISRNHSAGAIITPSGKTLDSGGMVSSSGRYKKDGNILFHNITGTPNNINKSEARFNRTLLSPTPVNKNRHFDNKSLSRYQIPSYNYSDRDDDSPSPKTNKNDRFKLNRTSDSGSDNQKSQNKNNLDENETDIHNDNFKEKFNSDNNNSHVMGGLLISQSEEQKPLEYPKSVDKDKLDGDSANNRKNSQLFASTPSRIKEEIQSHHDFHGKSGNIYTSVHKNNISSYGYNYSNSRRLIHSAQKPSGTKFHYEYNSHYNPEIISNNESNVVDNRYIRHGGIHLSTPTATKKPGRSERDTWNVSVPNSTEPKRSAYLTDIRDARANISSNYVYEHDIKTPKQSKLRQKLSKSKKKENASENLGRNRDGGDTTETDEECANLQPFSPISLTNKRSSIPSGLFSHTYRIPQTEIINRKAKSSIYSNSNAAHLLSPVSRETSKNIYPPINNTPNSGVQFGSNLDNRNNQSVQNFGRFPRPVAQGTTSRYSLSYRDTVPTTDSRTTINNTREINPNAEENVVHGPRMFYTPQRTSYDGDQNINLNANMRLVNKHQRHNLYSHSHHPPRHSNYIHSHTGVSGVNANHVPNNNIGNEKDYNIVSGHSSERVGRKLHSKKRSNSEVSANEPDYISKNSHHTSDDSSIHEKYSSSIKNSENVENKNLSSDKVLCVADPNPFGNSSSDDKKQINNLNEYGSLNKNVFGCSANENDYKSNKLSRTNSTNSGETTETDEEIKPEKNTRSKPEIRTYSEKIVGSMKSENNVKESKKLLDEQVEKEENSKESKLIISNISDKNLIEESQNIENVRETNGSSFVGENSGMKVEHDDRISDTEKFVKVEGFKEQNSSGSGRRNEQFFESQNNPFC